MKISTLLAVLLCGTQLLTAAKKPGVLPPQAKPYGLSYSEWSAHWWQWALSLPADQNPFFDETGCANGANGQSGPVYFLTGVINVSGDAVRDCTVPANKALFFPILNSECSTIEAEPWYGADEAACRACAEGWMNVSADLFCLVDGVPVTNLDQYRVQSPFFPFSVPENNVLGVEPGDGYSVSDGVFVMLPPLSVGQHTIQFGGEIADWGGFTIDITYNLTVVPPGK